MTLALVLLLLAAGQTPTGGKVESKADSKTNFAALRTYSWVPGWNAENKEVHGAIVAACDAEMTELGLTKVATGGDATLSYYSVRRADIDLKALDKIQREGGDPAAATRTLGRLAVVVRSGTPAQQIWSANTSELVDLKTKSLDETVRSVVERLFAVYPTRQPQRR
jgi:hypothetical protein